MTDPIADMLTRVRNAISVGKSDVVVPYSKMKESIAQLLVQNGFLESAKVDKGESIGKVLNVAISKPGENSKITEIDRLSKPGRRFYVGAGDIPTIKSGRGIVVVSTSSGLMTGSEAKKQGVGGELICKVY